jgi:hypothetical protein
LPFPNGDNFELPGSRSGKTCIAGKANFQFACGSPKRCAL